MTHTLEVTAAVYANAITTNAQNGRHKVSPMNTPVIGGSLAGGAARPLVASK